MTAVNDVPPVLCWICGHPASLETCKIDEYGLAVHEQCQALKLSLHNEPSRRPSGSTSGSLHHPKAS